MIIRKDEWTIRRIGRRYDSLCPGLSECGTDFYSSVTRVMKLL